jgi:hypothetical protein
MKNLEKLILTWKRYGQRDFRKFAQKRKSRLLFPFLIIRLILLISMLTNVVISVPVKYY